jgi:hypothetical protein
MLSVKEWNMDAFLRRALWSPFKWIGHKLEFITQKPVMLLIAMLFAVGLLNFLNAVEVPYANSLPYIFAVIALILILRAFAGRDDARKIWLMAFASQFFLALSIGLNKQFEFRQIVLYLSGGIISAIAGYYCLHKLKSIDNDMKLTRFHGHAYEHPGLAFGFLIASLGLVAFPITPAFIGFDILLTHIGADQFVLIAIASCCFVFLELSVLRIYARLFLGQHKRAYHPIAYRSS